MTSQQDGKGNVTTYMYNARNLLKAKIDPQGAGNPLERRPTPTMRTATGKPWWTGTERQPPTITTSTAV